MLLSLIYITSLTGQIESYFPKESINCTVLLENKIDSLFVPHGTGFLLYSYDSLCPVIVVTNEHVLRNNFIYITIRADSEIIRVMRKMGSKYIGLPPQNTAWELFGEKLRHKFILKKDTTYVSNETLDIAAFKLNIGTYIPLNDTTKLNVSDVRAFPGSQVKYKKDIPLGTNVFFTGFPFSIGTDLGWYYKRFTGLFSESIPTPLVRKGSIAWKSNKSNFFLLDAFSYGGNSGSPVFTTNDIQNNSYLIGIVSGHLPSEQSDNIGLANCIWMDSIMELIHKLK